MRVEGNRPLGPAAATRRDDKASGTGGFAEILGGEAPTAPPTTGSIGGLGALFALQEVPDPMAKRRKALARGSRILDRLKDLQLGLLDGTIDPSSLADLMATVRAERETAGDPALQNVLDEIELRAAVELAKLQNAV